MQLFRNILHSRCDRKERELEQRIRGIQTMYSSGMTQLATSLEEQKAIVDYTLLEKEQLEKKVTELTKERDHFKQEVDSLLRDNLTAGNNITKLVIQEQNMLTEIDKQKDRINTLTEKFKGKKKKNVRSGKFKAEPIRHIEQVETPTNVAQKLTGYGPYPLASNHSDLKDAKEIHNVQPDTQEWEA